MIDSIYLWLSILTFLFFIQGGLLIYFVRWVLWRWNAVMTDIYISKREEE